MKNQNLNLRELIANFRSLFFIQQNIKLNKPVPVKVNSNGGQNIPWRLK